MKILLVDDDPRLRDLLRMALEREEYVVRTASNGQDALVAAARDVPDLIVLDVGLPEMDGFEVCRRIRTRSDVPILFLTARDDEIDRVLGLEIGADDYVTKPFSPREVLARIRAILKRVSPGSETVALTLGEIVLYPARRKCTVGGTDIPLTATEFQLLSTLFLDPERLISRSKLVTAIWGARSMVSDRTFDSHLRNLRRKLSDAGCPDAIETVHGQGIRLAETT